MNYKNILKNNKGLSLIEIMVAFTILSVVFIGLIQAFPFGLAITKEAESSTVASYLAQDKIEELISVDYQDIGVGVIEAKHRLSVDISDNLYYYQRQTESNYVDGNLNIVQSDYGIKKVVVTVFFVNSVSKKEKSYSIATLISEK